MVLLILTGAQSLEEHATKLLLAEGFELKVRNRCVETRGEPASRRVVVLGSQALMTICAHSFAVAAKLGQCNVIASIGEGLLTTLSRVFRGIHW